MAGCELLQLQRNMESTDEEMAVLMGVPTELYCDWVNPSCDVNPPIRMVLKVAKTFDGSVHSSLRNDEKEKLREELYGEGEELAALLDVTAENVDDDDMPLHNRKVKIVQRLLNGLLRL